MQAATANDSVSEVRSRTMRAVKGKDTKPELAVRRLVHGMGFRYRLHRSDLPGKPDLVFPGRAKIIFVHGCFWHGHSCSRGARVPKTNRDYWTSKIGANMRRDRRHRRTLTQLGWSQLVIWECQLKKVGTTERRIRKFLGEAVH